MRFCGAILALIMISGCAKEEASPPIYQLEELATVIPQPITWSDATRATILKAREAHHCGDPILVLEQPWSIQALCSQSNEYGTLRLANQCARWRLTGLPLPPDCLTNLSPMDDGLSHFWARYSSAASP